MMTSIAEVSNPYASNVLDESIITEIDSNMIPPAPAPQVTQPNPQTQQVFTPPLNNPPPPAPTAATSQDSGSLVTKMIKGPALKISIFAGVAVALAFNPVVFDKVLSYVPERFQDHTYIIMAVVVAAMILFGYDHIAVE